MQHKPHISINRALMDTLDEKVKEAFVDASPSHALSYNSVTKQVCPPAAYLLSACDCQAQEHVRIRCPKSEFRHAILSLMHWEGSTGHAGTCNEPACIQAGAVIAGGDLQTVVA